MKMNGGQSSNSIQTEGKKYLLVYLEGNECQDFSSKIQKIQQKYKKARRVSSIDQIKLFLLRKKTPNVVILTNDVNSEKILKEVKYDFQMILHCTVESKCIHIGEDNRILFSSTNFQQILYFLASLNLNSKYEKIHRQ